MLAKARHDSHYLTLKLYLNDCSSITVNGETLAKTAQYYSIEELGVAMVSVDLEQIRLNLLPLLGSHHSRAGAHGGRLAGPDR